MFNITYKCGPQINDHGNVIQIVSPIQAYQYLMRHCYNLSEMWREKAFAVYLSKKCEVIGHMLISVGGFDSTLFDIRLILKGALDCQASKIIISHNHPTGDPLPSQADIRKSDQLLNACRQLELEMADHIVIGDNCFFSFHEERKIEANPKEMGITLKDNNPFCVPELNSMYKAVRDYIRVFQQKKGYILTDDDTKDTIWGYTFSEKQQRHIEKQVKAIRVNAQDAIEVLLDNPGKKYTDKTMQYIHSDKWMVICGDTDAQYIPTLFSIAKAIRDYEEQ
jgi:DNA repair protein RadC